VVRQIPGNVSHNWVALLHPKPGHCRVSRPSRFKAVRSVKQQASAWLARLIGGLVVAAWWSAAFAAVDATAYQPSTVEALVAEHGLQVESLPSPQGETRLNSPEFKYRLRLRATGRIRELTPESVDAIAMWGRMLPDLPAFLKEYTHEVEVEVDHASVWLLWQRSLVAPFRAERSDGGNIEVLAILAGTFRGRLLLFVTAFESRA